MITKEQVCSLTNEHGKKFVNMYLKNVRFDAIIKTDNNKSRKEFTLVFKFDSENHISCAILPISTSIDNGCCFFGDINHFAETVANHIFGITDSRYAWRFSDEDFNRYWKTVDSIVKRYT